MLIVAFSVGLAAVVTAIGLLAVGAKRTFARMSFEGRLVRALPAVSALVIIALGAAMTRARAAHDPLSCALVAFRGSNRSCDRTATSGRCE